MAPKAPTPAPDDIVRQYLQYLDNPASLRDDEELQARTQAVLDAEDPIDKLLAIAELERVANPDPEPLREAFVKEVLPWAEANGIPVLAFRQMSVPDDVLRDAGFSLPTQRQRTRATARTSAAPRQRAAAVPVDQIKAHVLDRVGEFTFNDITEGMGGGSRVTIRKAVAELEAAGEVENLGPEPDFKGPGRAPHRFQVTPATLG